MSVSQCLSLRWINLRWMVKQHTKSMNLKSYPWTAKSALREELIWVYNTRCSFHYFLSFPSQVFSLTCLIIQQNLTKYKNVSEGMTVIFLMRTHTKKTHNLRELSCSSKTPSMNAWRRGLSSAWHKLYSEISHRSLRTTFGWPCISTDMTT